MTATWIRFSMLLLGSGCAAGGTPAAGDGPEAQRRFERLVSEHTAIGKQLSSAPPVHRSQCEVSAGDCLLLVAERRDKLVSGYRLSPCAHFPDADAKGRCIAGQLTQKGHRRQLGDYYAFENWCLSKVVACTSTLAEEARLAALEARFETRKQQLELSPAGTNAWNAVELSHARVEYLRSTLPIKAGEICAPQAEAEACRARFEAEQKKLHEQLRRDDYDEKRGIAEYSALKQIEASCQSPELECLSSAMASLGVFPESRKWVDRNLALLEQRQTLTSLVSPDVQSECLTEPQAEHQPRIVEAYAVYSRQTVLFFRVQLDKAFVALHQAQVSCLSSKSKVAPAGEAPVAHRL